MRNEVSVIVSITTTYDLIYSDRQSVSLQIKTDGTVLVRAPKQMPKSRIDAFVESKRSWITAQLDKLPKDITLLSKIELEELKKSAKVDLTARVQFYAPLVGVSFSRISIRTQRSRWGSCSVKGNLNFNCLLMLAPEAVRDYVVVHELCHRRHLDHSPAFWAAVAAVMPQWKQHRQWLEDNGMALLMRLPD